MKNRNRLIRKITNLLGIGFMMLGVVPVSVLSQAGSVYAAEQAEDVAEAIVLPEFTSYAGLLGSTSVESSVKEMVVGLPDISGMHGDWISLAILGPVLAEEGDDPPAEEPPAEEAPPAEAPPAEEPPADEPPADEPPPAEEAPPAEEPPADEPPAEEPPAEEPPAEEPACEGECAPEPVEEAVVKGCTDPLADNYNEAATLDDDSCYIAGCTDPLADNYDAAATLDNGSCYTEEEPACEEEECAPEPAAEEEVVAEIVAAVAENDLVLADDSGEPLDMASQETVDLLSEIIDPWFFDSVSSEYYGFSSTGTCVDFVPVANCYPFEVNPIQAAINHHLAVSGTTIYILPDASYTTMEVDVTKDVTLEGVVGTTAAHSPSPTPVTIGIVNLYVDISDWKNVFASIVNVMSPTVLDTPQIQDGIDIAASGGVVNVSEGTYEEELSINKPLTLNGVVGISDAYGPGKGAPTLMQSKADWQDNSAITLGANGITIQGFIFKGFEFGVDINLKTNVNINNNMFLYLPSGGGIYTNGSPASDAYNIEFPPELNGYGKFYNNECDGAGNCTKVNGDADGITFPYTADVVVIKAGNNEFFFTPDNSTPCVLGTDLYCVTWNADGTITINTGTGQDISHVQFWNFEEIEPVCGDGAVNAPGETCEPPNAILPTGEFCRSDCTFCGDGVLNGGEACDPGITGGAGYVEGCTLNCTLPDAECGDGEVNELLGETCELPNATLPTGEFCRSDCTYCGDGVRDTGEDCDPGIDPNCRDDCTFIECGDGILDPPDEECDDGNSVDDDGCSNACKLPDCGDGIVQEGSGETCDPPGSTTTGGLCRDNCTFCGDGIINGDPLEECDGQDYCNDECEYKEFKDLTLDPHCSGPYTLIWSVINPNSYSVPNTHVVVDGVVKFDGTFPAGIIEVVMGTTADGPATHTMTATWEGGSGSVSTNEICEGYIPPPVDQPQAGEAFIIPVTGADLLGALASQQGMFFSIGGALLGLSLVIGRTKKKK